MCTAQQQKYLPDFLTSTEGHTATVPKDVPPRPIRGPIDVPLGDGAADVAKTAILDRRERLRRAIEGDGDPNEHLR